MHLINQAEQYTDNRALDRLIRPWQPGQLSIFHLSERPPVILSRKGTPLEGVGVITWLYVYQHLFTFFLLSDIMQ